jgi:hypothetical protein
MMQLKQWSRCLRMIEEFENEENSTVFDFVVKARPDDLWYGAQVPYCALDYARTAYIGNSRERRISDQFFTMPRSLAQTFLSAVHTDVRFVCAAESMNRTAKALLSLDVAASAQHTHDSFASSDPVFKAFVRENAHHYPGRIVASSPMKYFELEVFKIMTLHALRLRIGIQQGALPRLLSRPPANEMKGHVDIIPKCEQFFWFLSSSFPRNYVEKCTRFMTGATEKKAKDKKQEQQSMAPERRRKKTAPKLLRFAPPTKERLR